MNDRDPLHLGENSGEDVKHGGGRPRAQGWLLPLAGPCIDCPFRTDRPPFPLHPVRVRQIAELLRRGDTFWCHSTVDYREVEGQDGGAAEFDSIDDLGGHVRGCGGARAVAAHDGIVAQGEQVATRLGLPVPPLTPGAPVYPGLHDWETACSPGPSNS